MYINSKNLGKNGEILGFTIGKKVSFNFLIPHPTIKLEQMERSVFFSTGQI